MGRTRNELETSIDGGEHWLPLALPTSHGDYTAMTVRVNEQYPFLAYLTVDGVRYISFDGGHNWNALEGNQDFPHFLPYGPLTAYKIQGNRLLLAGVLDSEKMFKARVAPNYVPGGTYFLETGHNLWGEFKQYWDQHDGLCRFGYPVTEPQAVASTVGNTIYTVQQFERGTLKSRTALGSATASQEVIAVSTNSSSQNCSSEQR